MIQKSSPKGVTAPLVAVGVLLVAALVALGVFGVPYVKALTTTATPQRFATRR